MNFGLKERGECRTNDVVGKRLLVKNGHYFSTFSFFFCCCCC